jgi:hypothetical protein
MKKTGKILTLRGSEDVLLMPPSKFDGEYEFHIFDYSSFDQTRGWLVKDAYAWIDMIDLTGGGDTRVGIQMCLSTDVLNANLGGSGANLIKYLEQYSPQDNRTIAWNFQDYLRRDSTDKDFVIHQSAFVDATHFLHDRNRVITRDMYLNFYAASESGQVSQKLHWYIELEEVVLNPTESVMQQIKGIAQNIDN